MRIVRVFPCIHAFGIMQCCTSGEERNERGGGVPCGGEVGIESDGMGKKESTEPKEPKEREGGGKPFTRMRLILWNGCDGMW